MSIRYRVTAPLVIAPDARGVHGHYYDGDLIPWLSEESSAHLLEMGMVTEFHVADEPGDAHVVVTPELEGTDPGGEIVTTTAPTVPGGELPPPPPQIATKDVWVDYAVSVHGLDRTEASAMTRDQLRDLCAPVESTE